MSNWFHRNPLKATSKIKFDLGCVAESLTARSICNDAARLRAELLKLFCEPSVGTDTIMAKTQQYVSLMMGFVNPPPNTQDEDNKLRNVILFKWSNSAEPKSAAPVTDTDALFEVCSMLFTVALWLTKHAAKLSAKENISTDEAKDVHSSLREASGIFLLLREEYISNLSTSPKEGHDLHIDVLQAYQNQCTAEAQEVTVARAIELKHEASLIAGLAKATSSIYEKAGLSLAPLELKVVGKWLKFLEFKRHCYDCVAYVYFAEHLLKLEKAGAASAVMASAEKAHKLAVEAAKAYGKAHGVGLSAKPAEHCFFRRLGTTVENTKRKIERENGMIYRQRVPPVAPEFDLEAKFGVAEPKKPEIDFSPDARWKDGYMGFNEKKLLQYLLERDNRAKDRKEKTDRDAPVENLPEKPIFDTDKDPKNESGCVLS